MTKHFLSDYLQWDGFEGPGIVGLHNGGFMRTYRLLSPDLSHASKPSRLQSAERSSAALRRLRDRCGLHVEEKKVETGRYPRVQWPTTAGALLDLERERACSAVGQQFELQHLLTISQRPPERSAALVKKLFVDGGGELEQRARDEERVTFAHLCAEVLVSLGGVIRVEPLTDDETASHLYSRVALREQTVSAAAHPDLSRQLTTASFITGYRRHRIGDRYVSVIALSGFSTVETHPRLIDGLDALRFPYQRSDRWLPIERHEAKSILTTRAGNMFMEAEAVMQSIKRSFDKTAERPELMDQEKLAQSRKLGNAQTVLDHRGYGQLSCTFVVWEPITGTSKRAHSYAAQQCDEKATEIRKVLSGAGLTAKNESFAVWNTWLGSLPGHLHFGARKFPVTTRNFADIMPASRVWTGADIDPGLVAKRPWLYTTDGTPFGLSTSQPGGGANAIIFGAIGQARKSTLAGTMGLQYLCGEGAQVISMGLGKSELAACILSGGTVYNVGDADSPNSFQPLAFVDQPNEAVEQLDWLTLCLETLGVHVTPERREALSDGIAHLAGDHISRRTMTDYVRYMRTRAPDLAEALLPYTHAGRQYGHIFDGNNADALQRRRWTMFDLSHLLKMGQAALVPAVAHIMHRVEQWFDGMRTCLLMDEFTQWLHDERLNRFLTRVIDTKRKKHVRVLLVTQTPRSVLKHKTLAASIISGCAARIYGADLGAMDALDDYAEFGVTADEVERIAHLDPGTYLFKSGGNSRVFGLQTGPIALAMTGLNGDAALALLAELQRKCSDPDEMLDELLKAQGLEQQVKELRQWATTSRRVA